MNFRVKDKISLAPFNGGMRHDWTRAIKTNGESCPDLCRTIRNAQRRSFETRGIKCWTKSCEIHMLMFNRILVGLTGINIHSTSTMLADLQDKQIMDYTITMVKLLVNKTVQPRRVFRVARWTQVIELRISKLFENQVFLPAYSSTLLDDSTIII
jgi:hypothetical protein